MIRIIDRSDVPECVKVIRTSFLTVADELGFTPDNAPRFTAFATTPERLYYQLDNEQRLMCAWYAESGEMIGYYSLLMQEGVECELNNLCVLPQYRHEGIGKTLLEDAFARAKADGRARINIGIIEENALLRKWYEQNGFVHTGTKKYDFFPIHLRIYGEKSLTKIILNGGNNMALIEAGTPAPDFSLPDKDGNTVKLSAFRGGKVVVYFYARDNTPGCTRQARAFAGTYEKFKTLGVTVIGISRDSVVSHLKFAEKHSLPFILLSDPERQAIEAFGVWQEKKNYGKVSMGVVRTTFIIDENGIVEKVMPKVKPDTNAAEILEYLDK